MGCKYCKPRHIGDCCAEKDLFYKMFNVFGEPISITIGLAQKDKVMFLAINNTEMDIKIKYCPKCGRKLESEEGNG